MAAIGFGDPLPPGPYSVGLTKTPTGESRPFTIVCGDGRAIAGHVESKEIADAIAEAMNAHSGGADEDAQTQQADYLPDADDPPHCGREAVGDYQGW